MRGFCGYAKAKYVERVEDKRRRTLRGGHTSVGLHLGQRKLNKPPEVRSVSKRPRNRLKKQVISSSSQSHSTTELFVLEFEPYPHSSQPGKVLGIHSNLNSVTLGALKHGAYTFSREGLLDGNEYLSPTGRIRIASTTVQQKGAQSTIVEQRHRMYSGLVRPDIPHPENQEGFKNEADEYATRDKVYLAVREGPAISSWIGVFASRSLAWGACVKDKAMCTMSHTLYDETKNVGDNKMPYVSGRLAGIGRHAWKVEEHIVDGLGRTIKKTKQNTSAY